MIATLLQILGLIGLPVAGALSGGVAGGIAGASVSLVYLGLAMERD
jgi:hypothetical protein